MFIALNKSYFYKIIFEVWLLSSFPTVVLTSYGFIISIVKHLDV